MKKQIILFLICIIHISTIMSQDNYDNDWKKVQSFEQQGLPKSTIEAVEQIYNKARKQQDNNQLVKVMMHKAKYMLTLEENAQLNIIASFKKEIKESKFPKRNILESILAELYWQYFQQNRWKFYDRTKTTEKVDPKDFRTWDLETLFTEIHSHYQESLKNGVLAQQTDLSSFDELLIKAENSKKYRPTLFDFLSHNALSFYKTPETGITKPQFNFEIDNPDYLKDHQVFSRLKIITQDSLSLQFHALKAYQNLINFHSKDSNPEALTEINIERLQFVSDHGTFLDKQSVLLTTLQSEKNNNPTHASSALYDYEIARLYQQQAQTYIPNEKEIHRWKLKDAISICDNVIKRFPSSRATTNCNAMREEIMRSEVAISTEKYVPIQTAGRFLVTYKNNNKLYLRALKTTPKQVKKLKELYKTEDKIKFLKDLPTHTSWNADLRNEDDYQTHTTEVLLPSLEQGHYLIVATPKENITSDAVFSYAEVQITNLALIENKLPEKMIFQVVDRNHGNPIANAKINLKTDAQRGYRDQLDTTIITDAKGQASIKIDTYYYNVTATVTHEKDRAYFPNNYLNQSYSQNNANENVRNTTFLFTDRSIYRPGQTVYFKGITMSSRGNKNHKVIANQSAFARLRDVNGQEIKMYNFTTNEYGSFSGEFVLPSSGLTGLYSIQTSNYGSISISVEEYKRPKFETSIKPVTETYKVNDIVKLTGVATAYAGSTITDAKVTYKVQRKVQYPRWCYWYWPGLGEESQEIKHGETKTNEKGEYTIDFKAIPDATASKEYLPIFNYEITADVTDINGETRSTTEIVRVGYHALLATFTMADKFDKNKKDHTLSINTENLNNEPIAAAGTLKIHKLLAPSIPLRNRPWKAPDYSGFNKEEFTKLFPHDAFKDESDYKKWNKSALVMETSFNTSKTKDQDKGNQKIPLATLKKWKSGKYIAELTTTDRFGQEVKDIRYFTVYDQKDNAISDQQLFEVTTNKSSYKIGDEVIVKFSSASKDITITVDIEKGRKIIETQLIKLSENSKSIKIPVNKEDLGGFSIGYSFVNYNGFQQGTIPITIPYDPTDLSIETKTFRDKLKPGQTEAWSFTIKGPKGDKVSAELLASMYDASLDQFLPHQWSFNPINKPSYYTISRRNSAQSFGVTNFQLFNHFRNQYSYYNQSYDNLNWFGLYFGQITIGYAGSNKRMRSAKLSTPMPMESAQVEMLADDAELEEVVVTKEAGIAGQSNAAGEKDESLEESNDKKSSTDGIQIRKNLQETAFFFPQLSTDPEGNISFNFTAPEALTKWKLQLLAHTKELNSATTTLETVTQKELMVLPNPPRFLREGDRIILNTKIANLTDKTLTGQTQLQLFDALTNTAIDTKLKNTNSSQNFTVDAEGNTSISWELQIPDNVQTVLYKITAKADSFSDGEQNMLPVLSNRMLVTETLPMWIRSDQTKTFTLDKLKNNTSKSLKHHKLTLEMTSNPAWYAVQALPYLMEYPYDCSEQTFSKYYANTLASHIANSTPRIQEVFSQWKNTDALLSNLEKNQELKSLIIQETPWLRDAQSETEQKKRIALLFDLNKMSNEKQAAINKLRQMQFPSGAFPWFRGGRENRFITQHITTGFGHLRKLGVTSFDNHTEAMLKKALRYLDKEFAKEYDELKRYCKRNKQDISKDHLSYTQMHYLYMRSFYGEIKRPNNTNEAWNYYLGQSKKYWLNKSLYSQGLLALILNRNNDSLTATKILRSLDERSITSEELGMYWKSNTSSWYWYQAPIETQSLMIEVFAEVEKEPKRTEIIDNLKIWLLKNKQTNRWKTTKATADAVYALLLQGSDWLSVTDMVDIVLGDKKIDPSQIEDIQVEAGTGYFKTSWSTNDIQSDMATATISKKGKGIAWGALYWQYFEDLDKITSAETPLKLKKKLFVKKNTARGEEITEITKDTKLQLGDLVRVRIELRSDRTMEFVHMKDMRASGFEPINVISQYKWQDGLGYYESTKDASTNFFFDYLPKGVYVFEYDVRVNNKGDFSNGITTIQSMYAPEFSSHSDGVRVIIE